jgi:hypothetical protein
MELDRRGCVVQPRSQANRQREEPVNEAKPFSIPKRVVSKAFKRVNANQGATGVDKQSIAEFEALAAGAAKQRLPFVYMMLNMSCPAG